MKKRYLFNKIISAELKQVYAGAVTALSAPQLNSLTGGEIKREEDLSMTGGKGDYQSRSEK